MNIEAEIKGMSLEELNKLEETINEAKSRQHTPKALSFEYMDIASIVDFAEDVVNQAVATGYADENIPQYAFEVMMVAVYGVDFFKWYNKVVQ